MMAVTVISTTAIMMLLIKIALRHDGRSTGHCV